MGKTTIITFRYLNTFCLSWQIHLLGIFHHHGEQTDLVLLCTLEPNVKITQRQPTKIQIVPFTGHVRTDGTVCGGEKMDWDVMLTNVSPF